MAVQLSVTVRNARLDAIETAVGTSARLKIWTGAAPANCAAAEEQILPVETGGGYGYFDGYDRYRRKRDKDLQRVEDAKESEASIPDQLDAQIAQLLHEQEAKDLERADLARLQALADEYKGRTPDVPERVNAALLAAQERRTLGSLLALRRETDRTMEEEELVLLLLLLNE